MRVKEHLPYLLFIIILPLTLFWRWVFRGEVLYWGTILFQFWPWRYLVKKSLLAGEWPLWNPLLGNGTPLLANLQSAVFYPPNLLYLIMPVEHGLTLSVILHLALAGVLMYFYARQLELSTFAAVLAGLTYMLSGYLTGRTQFVTMINAAAWLPLLLLLCEKLVAGSSKRVTIPALAVVTAMPLLAGHAQLWFYSLWLVVPYTFFRQWQTTSQPSNTRRWSTLLHTGGWLALALTLAVLLAAAQILPTAELVLHSNRNGGVARSFALTYSFWPWRLITLLAPDFFGNPAQHNYWGYANYWEDHAYVGILPLALVGLAVWRWLRRQRTLQAVPASARQVIPLFAALIPLSLVLAMGWNTPVYLWVFDNVPGFDYFQAPARLLIWYTAALAILAGIGAHLFTRHPPDRRVWRILLVIGVAIAVAGLAGASVLPDRSQTFARATMRLGGWLALSMAVLSGYPGPGAPRLRTAAWQWIIVTLAAVDLLLTALPLIPTLPPDIFRRPIETAALLRNQTGDSRVYMEDALDYWLKFDRYFRFSSFGPADVQSWLAFRETLLPNLSATVELPSLNNDDPLVVGRWQTFANLLARSDGARYRGLLAVAGVGYVVAAPEKTAGAVLYQNDIFSIQQVAPPLPRAYFAPQAYRAGSEADVIARLAAPDFDSRREVVIMSREAKQSTELLASPSGGQRARADAAPVAIETSSNRTVVLAVDAPQAGYVVLTDTFYPGWQATVDGQPARIWPANLAFRAVAVNAGPHRIVFHYRPLTFVAGLWVSLLTALGLIVSGGIFYFNTGRIDT